MIRRLKPAYALYNFFKKSELEHNVSLYEKYKVNKKYYSSISSADFEHLDKGQSHLKDLTTEELKSSPYFSKLSNEYQDAMLDWSDNGYVVLRDFLNAEQVQQVNDEVERLLVNKEIEAKYGGTKIMFSFRISDIIKNIGEDEQLKNILHLLLNRKVDLFQSINFIPPSRQRTHSDSIHMSTYPYGGMVAVWIALEDVTVDQGPLHYYPGSHKLPYVMNKDYNNHGNALTLGKKTYKDYEDHIAKLIEEKQLEKKVFLAKKGDLLIWHANLLHGGEPAEPNVTRKSLVFHYYAKDVICYHEVTQRPTLKPKH